MGLVGKLGVRAAPAGNGSALSVGEPLTPIAGRRSLVGKLEVCAASIVRGMALSVKDLPTPTVTLVASVLGGKPGAVAFTDTVTVRWITTGRVAREACPLLPLLRSKERATRDVQTVD